MTKLNVSLIEKLALAKAKEFVREQSCGEWTDKQINEDAEKLVSLLLEFYRLNA